MEVTKKSDFKKSFKKKFCCIFRFWHFSTSFMRSVIQEDFLKVHKHAKLLTTSPEFDMKTIGFKFKNKNKTFLIRNKLIHEH